MVGDSIRETGSSSTLYLIFMARTETKIPCIMFLLIFLPLFVKIIVLTNTSCNRKMQFDITKICITNVGSTKSSPYRQKKTTTIDSILKDVRVTSWWTRNIRPLSTAALLPLTRCTCATMHPTRGATAGCHIIRLSNIVYVILYRIGIIERK